MTSLTEPGAVLLVSTYELGHQPAGITLPKAFLERAGFHPAALDLAVEPLDEALVRAARLIAVSVPMHTAARLGLAFAERARTIQPGALLAFHGLYAPLLDGLFRRAGACAVLGGECEEDLVALARAVAAGADLSPFRAPRVVVTRLDYPVPSRRGLPAPRRYARAVDGDGRGRLAGYAEATRGCKHLCRHCPIPALYRGRFFAIPVERVVEDVARQVEAGVQHITFGDPDFLNGPRHALRVAGAVHARFPELSFDFTAKIEHLVRHAGALPELRRAGALFAVSAVEALSDAVLARLAKGHTRADVFRAFEACRAAGLPLRASLIPFTPWSSLDEYVDLIETFARERWLDTLEPVQLSLRLLVPPSSLLLDEADVAAGGLDEAALSYRWRHPDPRMDALQSEVARVVEEAAEKRHAPAATFDRIWRLALAAAGRPYERIALAADTGKRAPRLTESWFC